MVIQQESSQKYVHSAVGNTYRYGVIVLFICIALTALMGIVEGCVVFASGFQAILYFSQESKKSAAVGVISWLITTGIAFLYGFFGSQYPPSDGGSWLFSPITDAIFTGLVVGTSLIPVQVCLGLILAHDFKER